MRRLFLFLSRGERESSHRGYYAWGRRGGGAFASEVVVADEDSRHFFWSL
jgi:hypothetical protein